MDYCIYIIANLQYIYLHYTTILFCTSYTFCSHLTYIMYLVCLWLVHDKLCQMATVMEQSRGKKTPKLLLALQQNTCFIKSIKLRNIQSNCDFLLPIQVCYMNVSNGQLLAPSHEVFFDPKDKGTMFLSNIRNQSPNTASCHIPRALILNNAAVRTSALAYLLRQLHTWFLDYDTSHNPITWCPSCRNMALQSWQWHCLTALHLLLQ